MKIRHYSVYSIWPIIGIGIGGLIAIFENAKQEGVFFLGFAALYIAIWFVLGFFKGSN
jgi:hypothetical protein